MDRKENLCMVSEDNVSMSALPKETMMQKKMNTRGGGCNMRKSLAWNKAFFTEEGVLDNLELSLLGRSSTKPSVNLLSVSEMSPLSTYSKGSIRPPLHDLEANMSGQVHKMSQNKVPKGRKLFSSISEESEVHLISGKTPSAKGIPRNIPRYNLNFDHTQKRVASVSTTNPTSKLLKFMPTKTYAATPPSSSISVMLATKSSKSANSLPKVNAGRGVVRAAITKNNSVCPSSSSKLSAADHNRKTNSQLNNGSTISKLIPKHLSSSKLNETITSGSVKAASSMSQGINDVHGGPAPVYARPSALRMPSPSLRFFCQGKASPSYDNQSQRPTQPSECKGPSLRQHMYLKRDGELRPLPSNRQQPTKVSAAIKSGAGTGISNSSVPLPAANFLKPPPSTSENHSSMEVNLEMKQADGIDKRVAAMLGGSHFQKDGQELSANHQLLDHKNNNQPLAVSSGKSNPDGLQEASDDGRSSESSNPYFSEGIPQSVKPNVADHVQSDCPSTRGFSGSEVLRPNTSSEIGFSRELKEHKAKEIQEYDSGSENMCIQSHVGVKLNETYPVSTEDRQCAENFDVSEQRYGFTVRNNQPLAVSSGKSNPDGLQEASDDGRSSESSNPYFSEGIPQSVKPNVADHVQSACPSTRGFSGSEVLRPNTSSEIGFSRELKEHKAKEIQEYDSGSENMCIQSHVGVKLNETYPVSTEDRQCAENFDVSEQRYGFTVRNIDCDTLLEAKGSLNQRTDQIASACLKSHIQLDDYSTKISSNSLQAAIPRSICVTSEVNTAFSEEFEPSILQDGELQHGQSQCDSRKGIGSVKEDLSMTVESISTDKINQGVPLGAVPFSDEWLAAVEAFGEDILEKKTGRVQNSPRDKASPEPGPWSPVKKKAQEIGPYDCTKYSKNNMPT
ncbi:uncharacterized protein M6B38_144310 [Iris pallida]|uniref:Uncharacterized protein n=1 Tax=Iris pallida TaxID=29817 RepID=A0AAX6FB69_IRIPA|nr:uncharacterized protein M6B38_144310 [Iris pallida]